MGQIPTPQANALFDANETIHGSQEYKAYAENTIIQPASSTSH